MTNQKTFMEFKEWRENHAVRNRNIVIIEKITDEKTGKDKYLTFNEKTGKITVNQTYENKSGEYIGIKNEKPFYLKDFKIGNSEEIDLSNVDENQVDKIIDANVDENQVDKIIDANVDENQVDKIIDANENDENQIDKIIDANENDERLKEDEFTERQINIMKILNKTDFTENKEICEILEISKETLRKELIKLEELDIIERENGKTKIK